MMWTSKEIKKRGMESLDGHLFQAFVIAFILRLLMDLPALLVHIDWNQTISTAQSVIVLAVLLTVALFVYIPLSAGRDRFFLELLKGRAAISVFTYFYTHGTGIYFGIIKKVCLRWLGILGRGLCLLIPGVMQYYSTFFMSRLLAQYPDLTAAQAQEKSKSFTREQKMNLFVMQLTFIGWFILSFFIADRFSLFLPYPLGRVISAAVFALPDLYYQSAVSALLLRFEQE